MTTVNQSNLQAVALLVICHLSFYAAFAQDLPIPNNPYDAADESIRNRNAFKRERWFYEQRMYPFNSIPKDAYKKALAQRDALREARGFFLDSPVAWTNIGPTPGYYFAYGNIASRIATIKIDPNNPSIVYVGAAFGGVWKSTNSGSDWTPRTDDEVSLSSGALAIDPANSNILYYGTGEATYSAASYYGRGLLKSTNAGDTWTNYTSGLPTSTYFSRLVIRPNNSNQLLAALGTSGLYRSTNGGQTWSLLVGGRCDDVVFSPSGDTAYIVGSGTGYRLSTNGGQSFTASAALSMRTRNHIAICRTSPNILYAATYSSTAPTIMVFKSTDAGTTFSQVSSGTDFSGSQAWYDFYMHVNPFDPNYAYVGSIDVWRTTNGGTSFQNITNGYSGGNVHVDQHNVDFHPSDPEKMYCVNDGGVWYSSNRGSTWTNLNSTLTLTQFYRITSDPSNSAHVLGGTQDNGTQRTTGAINWAAAFGGDGGEVCFQSQNPLQILGETQNNGVYRSTNGGVTWSSATTGLSGTGAWVAPIISHPDSANIFYTARSLIFKTTNAGANWFSISTGTSGTIREMAISRSSANIMFATSGSQVYRSTDRGVNWSLTSSGMPARTITSVYVHPDSSNVVFATFSGFGAGKIYRSANTGASWNNISGNLPDTPVNDALIYRTGTGTDAYLVATDVGVFISSDFGATWSELADGLPNTVAIHLDHNAASNKIRVGTHGRGVFETTITLATLAVVSPNGGEVWPIGTVQTIQWNSSSMSGNVKIELSRNGGVTFPETLFPNIPNTGSVSWTVTGASSSSARVRISSIDSPSLNAVSSADFSIVQPSVTILSPNGGDLWPTGSTRLIQWSTSHLTGNVKIELSRNSGTSFETLFASTANDGAEQWAVTGPATLNAVIRVSSLSNQSATATSGSFTISPSFASFVRLHLRDGGADEDSLEWGTGAGATDGIDELFGEHELPPPPPVGAFDVRWQIAGTQGAKRDMRDTLGGSRQQVTYTGRVQPGPGGYPFHLRWDRLELPAGSFALRYQAEEGPVLVNMKQEDSLVITDQGVELFQIVYNLGAIVNANVEQYWNIVSVPVQVGDLAKNSVFPTSISSAFEFTTEGYVARDTLGYTKGFWLKFPSSHMVVLTGGSIAADTFHVSRGWNMLGSISSIVPVENIIQIPNGIVVSPFFGFSGGAYNPSTVINPMRGYWVKVSQDGKLVLTGSTALRPARDVIREK
jgi:hypothetical protein